MERIDCDGEIEWKRKSWNFSVPASKRNVVFYLSCRSHSAYRVICPAVNTGCLHLHPFICSQREPEEKNRIKRKEWKWERNKGKERAAGMKSSCRLESKWTIGGSLLISWSSFRGLNRTEEVSIVNMEGLISWALTAVRGPNNVLSIYSLIVSIQTQTEPSGTISI